MASLFLRFPGGKSKALTFSYDDCVEQDFRLVQILKAHGMKGTFNLNSGLFAPEGTVYPKGKVHRRLSASQIKTTYPEDVCEIACHSYTHPFLTGFQSSAPICHEIMEDRKALEAMFQHPIHGMAYPYGPTNDMVVDVLKMCDIYYARTVESTEAFNMPTDWLRMPATCHHNHPRLMALADQFLSLKPSADPKLFYLWGHSYEFEGDDNWHVIEDFCDKMANNNDIWYATNMEIYIAWRDYMYLETSANGNMIYNPNVRSVWVAEHQKPAFEIKPGETVHI